MKPLLIFLITFIPLFGIAGEETKEAPAEVLKGEKALPGYWAADESFLYEQMLKSAAKALKLGQVTKKQLKSQATENSEMMLMQFTDQKESFMYSMRGKTEATYKITATRAGKNEIDITITSKAFGEEKSTFVIEGDTLVMTAKAGGHSIQFKRVPNQDAPARIARIKKLGEKK